MRLAVDVSKVGARDGIGSWTRGLLGGLAELFGSEEAEGESGIERVLLYDLSGGLDDDTLRDVLREEMGGEAGGELGPRFESRLGRPLPDLARSGHATGGATSDDAGDVFLAASWQIPPAWRRPVLFVVYDLTVLSHAACHTVDNRLHTLEGCLRALVTGARLLAISEATAVELEHHLDVPRSDVAVVHPGLERRFSDAEADAKDDEALRRLLRDRFGLEPGYVLAVGSLEPRKNLERLVDAHGALPDELRRRHPLVVVGGGGWQNESLDRALRQAESRGDVHRLGRVKGSDLPSLYRGAAVFAYPSLAEGFGLPVLEAMACGTPVLTSNRSSLPEVAGDAARLVDPDDTAALRDALADLLGDPAQRLDLSQRGLRRAKDFSWRRAAAEIVELCRELHRSADEG